MFKNYFKIAARTFLRDKGFSAINVLGLSVSLSLCLLVILFIQDQRRYDRFHEHADRIYRVTTTFGHGTRTATSPFSLGALLREDYPGVEAVVRMKRFGGSVTHNENSISIRGLYAEPSFLDVFSFDLEQGNPAAALVEPNTIVLSDEMALKLFRDEDPVGKRVMIPGQGDFTVSGVLKPSSEPSILKYDAYLSFASIESAANAEDWGYSAYTYYNYVLLEEGIEPETVQAQFPALIARHYREHPDIQLAALTLQSITKVRLGPMLGNQHSATLPPVIVYALAVIALVIMSAACFNYISLSVARAMKRAREVGVRKVVGAHRGQIAFQFVTEAVMTVSLAFLVAFGLLFWLVPAFNRMWAIQYTGAIITLDFTRDLPVLLSFLSFALMVGFLAGIYPAFYLSAFRPVSVLKGIPVFRGFSRLAFRKVLIVAQFAFSLLFIITTLLLYRQSNLMLEADYGFNTEHVVNVELQGVPYDRFKQVVERHARVAGVSATSFLAGTSDSHEEAIWTTEPIDPTPRVNLYAADYDFVDNLRLTLLAGRNFSPEFSTDTSQAVILNETAVRTLGFGTPLDAVGQTVHVGFAHRPEDAATYLVVGVVKDYHYTRLEAPIGPMLLYYRPERFRFASVRLHPGDPTPVLDYMEEAWKPFGLPFKYRFYDEVIQEEYAIYRDAVDILGLASFFAILIACLGLFGMATYTVERRTREVGVRKVMGAGVPGLVALISKEFLVLVGVAILLAVPVAYFLNHLWLERFAVRTAFDVWVFGLSILAVLMLAVLTISSQTLRAALTNPVETLRHE